MRNLLSIPILVLLVSFAPAQDIITTFAGGGPNNLPALEANVFPRAVTLDGSGNLYIASSNRVFKVDSSGTLTVVAGDGTAGFGGDGGPATQAKLNSPGFGLAVDGDSNLYIPDSLNHRIRRVDGATGIISTVAGNGTAGFSGDGGAAISAALRNPSGVAVDASGNLYIADTLNHRIRRVATGSISTLAGDGTAGFGGDGGPAGNARVNNPVGLAVDGSGNLFIADFFNHRVRRVDTSGVISTVAGNGTPGFGGDGGLATAASLARPVSVALDGSGNLYILDFFNHRIRRVRAADGAIGTVAGNGAVGFSGDNGPATAASFNFPRSLATDSAGTLYIADGGNGRVRRVVVATGIIATVAGNGGTQTFGGDGFAATSASFDSPVRLAVDGSGNVFITDLFNLRVRRVDAATGIITTVAGNGLSGVSGDGGPATDARLAYPVGVAVDSSGNLFIADVFSGTVRRVDAATGVITTVAGNGVFGFSGDGGPATSASLSQPSDVSVDRSGALFIADHVTRRVRRVDPGGDGKVTGAADEVITTVVGDGGCCSEGDGAPATNADLGHPAGMAFDAAGNLFFVDSGRYRIRRVDAGSDGRVTGAADEIISTVAGIGTGFGFSGDGGPATSASLNQPSDVSVDSSGNLFIADSGNNRIRRVDAATGVITTAAGNGALAFSGDGGPATIASLAFPSGLAISDGGTLLIADRSNRRIRRVGPNQLPIANAGPDQTLILGESVAIDGSASSDPDGSIDSFRWDFGDGSSSSVAVVEHTYPVAGQFTAALTVTDNLGAMATDTALITVFTTSQAVDSLSDVVESFNLQQGVSHSLIKKLELARQALDAGNPGQRADAVNKLLSFINDVEAQRGKGLTSQQADQLVAAVNRILAVL